MEYGYTILMEAFGAALLIVAAITAIEKSKKIIPFRYRDKAVMKDEKLYMTGVAKMLALVAFAPIISGALALLVPTGIAFAVLVVLFAALIYIGVRITRDTRE